MQRELFIAEDGMMSLSVDLPEYAMATINVESVNTRRIKGEFVILSPGTNEYWPRARSSFEAKEGDRVSIPECPDLVSFTVLRLQSDRAIIDLHVPEQGRVTGFVIRECVMPPHSQLMIGSHTCLKIGALSSKSAKAVLEDYDAAYGKIDGNEILHLRRDMPSCSSSSHRLVPGRVLALDERGTRLTVRSITCDELAFSLKLFDFIQLL